MYYYLIVNNKGLQPVKSKKALRNREQGREVSVDGTCSGIIVVNALTYFINKIKWGLTN